MDEAAKAEIKDFYMASSPPPVNYPSANISSSYPANDSIPSKPHPERIAPLRERAMINQASSYPGGSVLTTMVSSEKHRGTPVKVCFKFLTSSFQYITYYCQIIACQVAFGDSFSK